MKFESVTVSEIITETPESYTIRFEAPAADWLNYLPGQYLTIKIIIDGQEYRRAYSLSSCPDTDKFLSVTVKAVEGGKVSNYLKNNLKKGEAIQLLPPMGSFTVKIEPQKRRKLILAGAGSGITPLMSILKSVLHSESGSSVSLIYGNRDEKSIVFYQQLEELSRIYPDRLEVVHILSRAGEKWTGEKGRIEGAKAVTLLKNALAYNDTPDFAVYLCGPQGMMDACEDALKSLNVNPSLIHREYYSAPIHTSEENENEEEIDYEIKTREIEFILDGVRRKATVDAESNMLQAVIDLDVDPPYACQEGVCSTCRAKVHSGLVQMYVRDGLSDEEIEAGYVLTCQCVPLTDDVVIEFA